MNLETQKQSFAAMVAKMEATLFKKGNDYANTDRLSNFKLAGSIAGGSAETNCLKMIATKVSRLGVLLNSDGKPNNESIEDSILDLANYAVLLGMILEDKESYCMEFPEIQMKPEDLEYMKSLQTSQECMRYVTMDKHTGISYFSDDAPINFK